MLGVFRALRGRPEDASGAPSRSSRMSTQDPSSAGGTASRKQMLALVLRETLRHNDVPREWLGMEFFRTMDRSGARTDGIHVRLVVRDGHPALPARMVALERDFRRRVSLIDYRASSWLQGVSWQFDLAEADEPAPSPAPVRVRPNLQEQRFAVHTYAATAPAQL